MNIVNEYLSMSQEAIEEAEYLQKGNFYKSAVSRAYYACYYSVQAILESIKVTPKTHQGALIMFSKHFIKTGVFPVYYSKFFQNALYQRLAGDYEVGFKATNEDAEIAIQNAKDLFSAIKKHLNKKLK